MNTEMQMYEASLRITPDNIEVRMKLESLYVEQLGFTVEKAKLYVMSVWHPHKEAEQVTEVVRMFGDKTEAREKAVRRICEVVGLHPEETIRFLFTSGTVLPHVVSHEPTRDGPTVTPVVVVPCGWLLLDSEEINLPAPPRHSRPRRRRW